MEPGTRMTSPKEVHKHQSGVPRHPTGIDGEETNECVRWCFTELDPDALSLNYGWPSNFVTSQWTGRPRIYIIYRIVVGVALFVWMLVDIAYETTQFYHGNSWRWFMFASNWSFAILTVSAVVQAITSTLHVYKPYWIIDPVCPRVMPAVLKIQWVLFNISSNSTVVVTSGYWLFIAFLSDTPLLSSDMSRFKHTINTICVLADVMTSATPIRLYHVFYTLFFGSLYIVFSAMYFISWGNLLPTSVLGLGRRNYYFLNWATPVEAVCTCVLGIMLCAAWQLMLHGLYKFRVWLHGKVYSHNPSADSELQNIVTSSESYNSLEESYK